MARIHIIRFEKTVRNQWLLNENLSVGRVNNFTLTVPSRTVGAHFGLTPRRYQSGEHDNPGRISKAGDRDVRATLYAAANALLMRTMAGSQIKSWGMRLMRTKGRRRAVVAVARKLAVLLHRMWIDGTEFRQDQVGGKA
jgi:transposase